MEGHLKHGGSSDKVDVLPTTSNLHRWRFTEDPSCALCGKPANLEHILSSCQVRLTDGRFRWHHDQVLAQLVDGLEKERKRMTFNTQAKGPRFIAFLGPREKTGKEDGDTEILGTAKDCKMRVQIRRQLKFPEEITITSLQPDIVSLWSQASKQVAPIELMVPWEERIEEANERKQCKYQSLFLESQQRGWRAWNLPVEVSCRGFPGESLWRALEMLGVRGSSRKNLVENISKRAEAASRWLWLKKGERWLNQASRGEGRQSRVGKT